MKAPTEYRYNGGFEPVRPSSLIGSPWDSAGMGSACDIAGVEIDDPYYFGPRLGSCVNEGLYYFGGSLRPTDGIYYFGPCDKSGEVGDGGDAKIGSLDDLKRGGSGNDASMLHRPELMPGLYPESDVASATTRPLTVAYVGPYLLRGGAEQWLLDLAKSLDPARLRIVRAIATYADLVDFEYASELAQRGMTVEIGREESIRAAARECDVLLTWGMELDHYLGDVKAPVSVHVVHGDGPINRRFLDGSQKSVDHVVAVSHGVRDRVCRERPATVIYNGVDAGRLVPQHTRAETRARLGFARGDFVVGFFGRMAGEKRVGEIIEAVAALPERFKLLMVGWGVLYPELREQARKMLLGRHRFAYSTTALGELYRAADAVCLASDQEGFPMVMLEAMSCGRPFVTTPVGSAREIIEDRVNGLLFDGGPASLAAALSRLARYPDWRRGVGRSGRRTFQQFGTARRMARDYEHLVRRLWAEKHAA